MPAIVAFRQLQIFEKIAFYFSEQTLAMTIIGHDSVVFDYTYNSSPPSTELFDGQCHIRRTVFSRISLQLC
jgi:hypothetical protein